VYLGQPAAALAYLQAALTLAESIASCAEQSWLHAGLAEACRLAGEGHQARTHARRALSLAQAHSRPWDQALAQRVLTAVEGDGG
jgi:hypothetical protein